MVRKKLAHVIIPHRCPICGYSRPTLRGLAQHIAMKRDEKHASWREKHGLLRNYETMAEVLAMKEKIINILISKYGMIPRLNEGYMYEELKKYKKMFL